MSEETTFGLKTVSVSKSQFVHKYVSRLQCLHGFDSCWVTVGSLSAHYLPWVFHSKHVSQCCWSFPSSFSVIPCLVYFLTRLGFRPTSLLPARRYPGGPLIWGVPEETCAAKWGRVHWARVSSLSFGWNHFWQVKRNIPTYEQSRM